MTPIDRNMAGYIHNVQSFADQHYHLDSKIRTETSLKAIDALIKAGDKTEVNIPSIRNKLVIIQAKLKEGENVDIDISELQSQIANISDSVNTTFLREILQQKSPDKIDSLINSYEKTFNNDELRQKGISTLIGKLIETKGKAPHKTIVAEKLIARLPEEGLEKDFAWRDLALKFAKEKQTNLAEKITEKIGDADVKKGAQKNVSEHFSLGKRVWRKIF